MEQYEFLEKLNLDFGEKVVIINKYGYLVKVISPTNFRLTRLYFRYYDGAEHEIRILKFLDDRMEEISISDIFSITNIIVCHDNFVVGGIKGTTFGTNMFILDTRTGDLILVHNSFVNKLDSYRYSLILISGYDGEYLYMTIDRSLHNMDRDTLEQDFPEVGKSENLIMKIKTIPVMLYSRIVNYDFKVDHIYDIYSMTSQLQNAHIHKPLVTGTSTYVDIYGYTHIIITFSDLPCVIDFCTHTEKSFIIPVNHSKGIKLVPTSDTPYLVLTDDNHLLHCLDRGKTIKTIDVGDDIILYHTRYLISKDYHQVVTNLPYPEEGIITYIDTNNPKNYGM